jgi:hypothetical protein
MIIEKIHSLISCVLVPSNVLPWTAGLGVSTKKAYEEIVRAGYLREVSCDEPRHPDGSIDVDGRGGQKRWCIASVVRP